MLPELSIVKVDKRKYRTIAQENWGLTKEQMKGMHVHHRIPVSDEGTNDPSNLYVCSPSMHRWGWHNGEEFIEWANEGGRKGGAKTAELGVGIYGRSAEQMTEDGRKGGRNQPRGVKVQNGRRAVEEGTGIHGRSAEQMTEDGRKGGRKGGTRTAKLGVGAHAPGMASEGGKKSAELGVGVHAPGKASEGGKTTNSQKWQSTDPNHPAHISNSGGLSRWQKARGIDTSMRVKVAG